MKDLETNAGWRPPPRWRRRAENILKQRRKRRSVSAPGDAERLLHELQVRVIELEMQNEALCAVQADLEKSRAKYAELYRSLEAEVRHRQRAERALKEILEELESRVLERTAELARANQAMAAEIAQRVEDEHARNRFLGRLIECQEAERGRIARGLHDQFGQDLAALSLALKRINAELPPNTSVRSRVGQATVTLGNLMRDAHGLVWDLRPPALDDFGLGVALRRYTSEWAGLHCIPMDFHCRGLLKRRLPPPAEEALYRIAQEALTNVYKHAQASGVSVLLERRPHEVALIVEDRGRGFRVGSTLKNGPSASGHLGLLGMRERASLVGGTLDIESTPGSGTTLFARIPLAAACAEDGQGL